MSFLKPLLYYCKTEILIILIMTHNRPVELTVYHCTQHTHVTREYVTYGYIQNTNHHIYFILVPSKYYYFLFINIIDIETQYFIYNEYNPCNIYNLDIIIYYTIIQLII